MTAIVWKNGTLATDSRETEGPVFFNEKSKKIHKYKHFVLAACGNSSSCAWFYNWMYSNFLLGTPPTSDEAAVAYLVDKKLKKLFKVYSNGQQEELDTSLIYVDGSVWKMLTLLMKEFKNMTPEKAIKICAKYDGTVNNKVQKVKCW